MAFNQTYVPTPKPTNQAVTTNYPKGVALPLGYKAVSFEPPQKGQSFIAADVFKGKKTTGPDMRVVVAKQNNSANSAARVIVTLA